MSNEEQLNQCVDPRILSIRGMAVILDIDLAVLFGVTPGALLQGVRRNRLRFPPDFLFQLSNQELARLKSQSVISNASGRGGRRHRNWAFTEQGVAMLSSVLRSETAMRVDIEIMRAFVRLRRAAIVSEKVLSLVEDLSKRVDVHDAAIMDIVESIRQTRVGSSETVAFCDFSPRHDARTDQPRYDSPAASSAR